MDGFLEKKRYPIILNISQRKKRGKIERNRTVETTTGKITNNIQIRCTNLFSVETLLDATRPCSTSSDLSSRDIAFVAARGHVRFAQLSHNDSLVSPCGHRGLPTEHDFVRRLRVAVSGWYRRVALRTHTHTHTASSFGLHLSPEVQESAYIYIYACAHIYKYICMRAPIRI